MSRIQLLGQEKPSHSLKVVATLQTSFPLPSQCLKPGGTRGMHCRSVAKVESHEQSLTSWFVQQDSVVHLKQSSHLFFLHVAWRMVSWLLVVVDSVQNSSR